MANINRYQKEILLQLEDKRHWTADALYGVLRKTYFLLWRGTVYRNLDEMHKEWLIDKQYGLGDKVLREIKKPPHCHIYCEESNSVMDVPPISVDDHSVQLPSWFAIRTIQIVVEWEFWDESCKIKV